MYGRDTRDLGAKNSSSFIEYLKVFFILLILRVGMIEMGVTIINIPFLDGWIREALRHFRNFMLASGF